MDDEEWRGRARIYLIQLFLGFFITLIVIFLLPGCAQAGFGGAPPTIKIGLVAPFEGLNRSLGYEILFAVKLALQEKNKQGINGYRVELVALNDFNDPDEAEIQAKALLVDPDIMGVIGHLSSATTAAALPLYQTAGLALCVPWAIDAELYDHHPGMVGVAATTDELSAQLRRFSQARGWVNIATLTEPEIEAIPAGAQAVQLATEAVTAGEIILALKRENLSLPLLGQADAGSPQLLQVAEAAANGLIFVSPAPAPEDLPQSAAFIEAYQNLAGFPPGPRAILAYDATHILLEAIEQAIFQSKGRPTRAGVSATIIDVQRPGLSGDIAFNTQGQRLEAPVWIYQIVDEKYPGALMTFDISKN